MHSGYRTSFNQTHQLSSFRTIHTRENPYECKECDQSFSWKCHLISHQVAHTEERALWVSQYGWQWHWGVWGSKKVGRTYAANGHSRRNWSTEMLYLLCDLFSMDTDLGFNSRLPVSRFRESGHFTPSCSLQVWRLREHLVRPDISAPLITCLMSPAYTLASRWLPFFWKPTLMTSL